MGVAHWVAALVGIFAVTLIFLPVFGAFDLLATTMHSNMPNGTYAVEQHRSLGMVEMAFFAVPIILIIGLLLYAIASSERREYDSTRDRPDF
jgi:heme/copper-type cytochrome/quinol oxidase subunit 2